MNGDWRIVTEPMAAGGLFDGAPASPAPRRGGDETRARDEGDQSEEPSPGREAEEPRATATAAAVAERLDEWEALAALLDAAEAELKHVDVHVEGA